MTRIFIALLCTLTLNVSLAFASATPGKPAPDFKVKDANGKEHSLSDYKGQWLVLEWFNKGCPYVQKHYESGNMQKLQKKYTEKKVKWLTVISSAKGKQGYEEPKAVLATAQGYKAAPTAILLDSSGTMGKAYGAKTTPHMYIVNPKGELVYNGAIDDNDSSRQDVIPKSKNYVVAALDSAMAGKKVETASTRPYGCSVKY